MFRASTKGLLGIYRFSATCSTFKSWCSDSSSRLSKRFFVMCSFCFSPLILTDNADVRLSLIQRSKHRVDSAWSIHIVSNNLILSCFLYLQAASSIYGQTDRCESTLYRTMCIHYYLHLVFSRVAVMDAN